MFPRTEFPAGCHGAPAGGGGGIERAVVKTATPYRRLAVIVFPTTLFRFPPAIAIPIP